MALYCEFTVINRSQMSLRIAAQHNEHGDFDRHGTGMIAPSGVARLTAEDPGLLSAYGSEGWITFMDDAGCVFTLRYCCSYAKKGNYCVFSEHSPLLDVSLRFGNETPPVNGDKHWGSANFPLDGHPLGILVYIEPRTPQTSLKVLTYNAHLFEGSMAVIPAREIKGIELVFADGPRAGELLRRIATLNPDVICLQEVWALADQKGLADALKGYPHVFLVPDKAVETEWWEDFLNWIAPILLAPFSGGLSLAVLIGQLVAAGMGYDSLTHLLRNALSNTSGLLFLSKLPFKQGSFTLYTGLEGEDMLGKKGMIDATLMFAADARTPAYVRIGTTHCPTNVPDAQRLIRDVTGPKVFGDGGFDRILVGDFNLHVSNAGEYQTLNDALGRFGAKDLVKQYIPEMAQAYTEWQAENSLTWALDVRTRGMSQPTKGQDRIDFVYFAPRASAAFVEPSGVSIPHDWDLRYPVDAFGRHFDLLSVSDHYPVISDFKLAMPAIAYKDFSIQTGTGLALDEYTRGNYYIALAAGARATDDADLYCIKRSNNESGKIGLRVLKGGGWQSFGVQTPVKLNQNPTDQIAYFMGDFLNRGANDLYMIRRSGNIEVHILDSYRNFGEFHFQQRIPIAGGDADKFEFFLGHYHSEGRPDLFCIKRRDTPGNKLEIHVLSGASNYQSFSLQMQTSTLNSELDTQARLAVARFNRNSGNSDILLLKPGATTMEVRVLDGCNQYRPMARTYATGLQSADLANFDFRVGDCAVTAIPGPIYAIKRTATGTRTMEVHVVGRG